MGDVLIHAGDFSNTGEQEQIEDLHAWLVSLPHKYKIVIAGNHDTTFDTDYYLSRGAKRFHALEPYDPHAVRRILVESDQVVYLEDSAFVIPNGDASIKVWGSPYQPEFCDWAFNLPIGEETRAKAKEIPTDVDVLVTHGPPAGHGDLCSHGAHAGCAHLLEEIRTRVMPSVHIFGHIHEGYGVTKDEKTTYVNASSCTLRYAPSNPAVVFDMSSAGKEISVVT